MDKTQDREERVKRGTHIQIKWKLEQEDDNSNQGATSHSSCTTLKSRRLEVKGCFLNDTLDNKAV